MASRKPRTRPTDAPKDTATDGAVSVEGTETVTETPVDDVTKAEADAQSDAPTQTPEEAASTEETGTTTPEPAAPEGSPGEIDASEDKTETDGDTQTEAAGGNDPDTEDSTSGAPDADEEVNPGAPTVIKQMVAAVEGVDPEQLDPSKLTAVINPDRSGYDGALKDENGKTIALIDCGPDSASAADIKADLMAAGMSEESIQVLRD